MYDAQRFDVEQDFRAESENTESIPFNQGEIQDYRLRDSLCKDPSKFDFPSDPIIFDESITKTQFDQINNQLFQNAGSRKNKKDQVQRGPTANFDPKQIKNYNQSTIQQTPAFKIQMINDQKSDQFLQLPSNNSLLSSLQNQQQSIQLYDQNQISFGSEDQNDQNSKKSLDSKKLQYQPALKQHFSNGSSYEIVDSPSKKFNQNEDSSIQSISQTRSILCQTLPINYGDINQHEDQQQNQSVSSSRSFKKPNKKQNFISKILQLENRPSYRIQPQNFIEDIIFDPVDITMKSGINREVSLALRYMRPEAHQKESFYMPKIISVESRSNNKMKSFKQNRFLSAQRQERKSIQDKLFHESSLLTEDKQQKNSGRNRSILQRQLSNRSLKQDEQGQSSQKQESLKSSLQFDDSRLNLKGSSAKSEKEKTKMSINLKTEIECLEPQKFAKIMAMDGINPQDVIKSLSIEANHKQLFKAGEGSGQSGSFFFFSWDKKLLIKTLRGKEKKNLLNMLDQMIEYFEKVNNRSLLARIYGCFTIKSNYFPPLDVIVMQNATQLIAPKKSEIINFDLKGSTKGRKTRISKEQEKFWKQKMHFKGTLKDLNLVEIIHDKGSAVIQITEAQFDSFEYIIRRDSQFLRNHNLMDYSLLLTIEHLSCTKEQYEEQQAQVLERINQKQNLQTLLSSKKVKFLDTIASNSSFLGKMNPQADKTSNQKRKTQALDSQASIKNLLQAPSIADLQEQSLRLHNDYFLAFDQQIYSSIISDINNHSSKTKSSIASNKNNKSEEFSEENMMQEYKENKKMRNFLKTQIFKEQVIKKEDTRKSNNAYQNLQSKNSLNQSVRGNEESCHKKQIQNLKQKKSVKKERLGDSFRNQENNEDEIEYKYYRQVAHLAIIDYLQEWSFIKKMENALSRFTLSKQEINTISAVHPELYQSRFENFMVQQFLKPGREKFLSCEQKNYQETCDEFLIKLAFDIRMSELELDNSNKLNFVAVSEMDKQLTRSDSKNMEDVYLRSKDDEQRVSFKGMEQNQNKIIKAQNKQIQLAKSEEFVFENIEHVQIPEKRNFNINKSEIPSKKVTMGLEENQNLIEEGMSEDGQQS